jgi:hypothetical protein
MHDMPDSHPLVVIVGEQSNSEDLTVQMRDDEGIWHRRAIGGFATACGDLIEHRLAQAVRHESYLDRICRDGCFSHFELALSEQANRAERERP